MDYFRRLDQKTDFITTFLCSYMKNWASYNFWRAAPFMKPDMCHTLSGLLVVNLSFQTQF